LDDDSHRQKGNWKNMYRGCDNAGYEKIKSMICQTHNYVPQPQPSGKNLENKNNKDELQNRLIFVTYIHRKN